MYQLSALKALTSLDAGVTTGTIGKVYQAVDPEIQREVIPQVPDKHREALARRLNLDLTRRN